MKIRWKNTLMNPETNEEWIIFICKYPFLYLIPATIMSGLGYYFYLQLVEFETGNRNSIYLGELKILHEIFGKWGIVGFFIFLTFCFLYLFWIYAISQPEKSNNKL